MIQLYDQAVVGGALTVSQANHNGWAVSAGSQPVVVEARVFDCSEF